MATLIDLQSWYRKGEENNERENRRGYFVTRAHIASIRKTHLTPFFCQKKLSPILRRSDWWWEQKLLSLFNFSLHVKHFIWQEVGCLGKWHIEKYPWKWNIPGSEISHDFANNHGFLLRNNIFKVDIFKGGVNQVAIFSWDIFPTRHLSTHSMQIVF